MSTTRLALHAVVFGLIGAVAVHAENISAKKMFIKDHVDPAKRQLLLQSSDAGVQAAEVDNPGTNGATIHVYSATDDACISFPAGADWKNKNGTWRYNNKATKNVALVKDGKLVVKVKSGVSFTLADNGTQGHVNAQVQFGGAGTRYCLRCAGNKKDDAKKFLGTKCVAATCDTEPATCGGGTTTTTIAATTTTTTTTSAGTTTTTMGGPCAATFAGALPQTVHGKFNFNLTLGVPAADAECNTNFAGSHACTFCQLQTAASAGQLVGVGATVWVIDPTLALNQQCGITIPWDYQTADHPSRGEKVTINPTTGALGSVETGFAASCNTSNSIA